MLSKTRFFIVTKLLIAAMLATHGIHANAVVSFIVKDIKIEGLQHIEPMSVFSYLTIKKGDIYNDNKASEAIHALYATGFFENIQISTQNNSVIVRVQERCVISSIELIGIKEFENSSLINTLRKLGISVGSHYDGALIHKAEKELKLRYLAIGFYGAKVETIITPIDKSRVHILFSVLEGSSTKIRQINFIGNKIFSTNTLYKEMQLSTSNLFSWYTKDNIYTKEKLARDLEAIRFYYLNRGYVEFNIQSVQVSISPDKKDIFLTVTLYEGEPYLISDIRLVGNLLNHDEELQELIKIRDNDCFSSRKLDQTVNLISKKLSQYGYALATVKVQSEINQENHKVSLIFIIEPGYRVYVRHVNIIGNTRTRDEVIRREFLQLEGSWLNSNSLALSNDHLNRLGYFKKVDISTTPVEGVKDQVDVNVIVNEKQTGTISLGAGFSQTDKIILSASVSQENVFGSGTGLSAKINTAKNSRTLEIMQKDPYFTIDGINRTTDIYYRTYKPLNFHSTTTNNSNFRIIDMGANIKFGVPVSEFDTFYLSVALQKNHIDVDKIALPDSYRAYIKKYGRVSTIMPITTTWLRDKRDSNIIPKSGYFVQVSTEYSPRIYELSSYYKLDLKTEYYHSFSSGFILGFNLQGGYGRGMFGRDYPIFKNYYAGGVGSIRGYETHSLGSQEKTTSDWMSGSKTLIGNIELTFPLLNFYKEDQPVRIFTFLDGGNAWNGYSSSKDTSANGLRYSYGVGLVWISEFGPLKLSLGFPIQKHPGDRYQKLQFQFGTSF